jgi:hypothetical protein
MIETKVQPTVFKDKVYRALSPSVYTSTVRASEGRQGFKDNVYHFCHPPTPVPHVTHCSQTLSKGGPIIHEGRSDYPMSPQQPQFRLIRSSRLPMKPVTPEGPGRRCVKVGAVTKTVIEKEKKPSRRNRNGLNRRR